MSKHYVNIAKLRLAIITGQKRLVNDAGQVVFDIDNASLAIGQNQKVVQDKNGTCYLLRHDQNLDQIKREFPHELDKLKLDFEQKKHEFLAAKAALKEKKLFIPSEEGQNKRHFNDKAFNPLIDNTDTDGQEGEQTTMTGKTHALTPMPTPTRIQFKIDKRPTNLNDDIKPKPSPVKVDNSAPNMTPINSNPVIKTPSDIRFNLTFINSVFGQGLTPEALKIAPFLGYMTTDLRMLGLLTNIERSAIDAAKANVADLDFSHELSNGATYPIPTPTHLRPQPK